MKSDETKNYSIAVFPFLKTDEQVTIGSVTFRPTSDIDALDSSQASSVHEIAQMLYLKGDLLIESPTYAIVPRVDPESPTDFVEYLRNLQAFVAYVYTAPRHEFGDIFLPPEYATMLILTPAKVIKHVVFPQHLVKEPHPTTKLTPNRQGEIDGYDGLYNFAHHVWVAEGSRIYGPIPEMSLNLSQSLAWDVRQSVNARCDYRQLMELLNSNNLDSSHHVFLALRWFNSANSRAIGSAEAIVNLVIAFESLMRLPENSGSAQLVDTISVLLGRVPRLDTWASQLYAARSKVVHEGILAADRFVVGDSRNARTGRQYQSLLSYGRTVFQLCLGTLLTGHELAARYNLREAFITNEERFLEVCTVLGKKDRTPRDQLEVVAPIVEAIDQYKYVPEEGLKVKTILNAARLAAVCFSEHLSDLPDEAAGALSDFANVNRKADDLSELEALKRATEAMSQIQTSDQSGPRGTLVRILEISWWYLFMHYYWLKDRQAGPESEGAK